MNINNLLQLLVESREIEEIKEKNKGKGIDDVLDTLASLMKGNKYDPTAMAIINTINDDDFKKATEDFNIKDNYEFLKKRAKLIYAALKEAAKGKSDYNPGQDLSLFLYGNNEDPIKWWSEYRSGEKKVKEINKNTKEPQLGIKGAKPIETKDAYLFIPHSFKFDNGAFGGGFRISDLEKQWQDLKALSEQMAKKDTSGKEGANVNHWCVSSDNSKWFKSDRYKGGHKDGIFVIIVNKNKDGSPNWNERYLYWDKGGIDKRPSSSYDGYDQREFANKFNYHYEGEDMEKVVSKNTLDFIEKKIFDKVKLSKGDEQYDKMKKEVSDIESNESYTKKGTRRVDTSSNIFKNYIKIVRFLRNSHEEEEATKRGDNDPRTLLWRAIRRQVASGFIHNPDIHNGYYTVRALPSRLNKDETYVKVWRGEKPEDESWAYPDLSFVVSREEAQDIKQNINNLEPILKKKGSAIWQQYQMLKPNFSSKSHILYDDEAPKGVKDALKNNKYAIDMWEANKRRQVIDDDEIREFYIGPYFMVTVRQGSNELWFSPVAWDRGDKQTLVGYLNEKDIVEKAKKLYSDLLRKKKNEYN